MYRKIGESAFGETGHQSSRVIFGGTAVSDVDPAEADRVLEMLLRYGVNHIDTSVTYGDSEKQIGRWMKDHRNRFFLATKIDARTYSEARREFDTSLRNLNPGYVDLLQMHELVRDSDADTFFSTSGAVRVLDEARQRGLARFVGVTAHGFDAPKILQRCIEEFDFDSVLVPFNYYLSIHPQYRPDFDALVESCTARGIAIQTIKAIARGPWGDGPRTSGVWYRPLDRPEDIDKTVRFVLSFPDLFLCSAGDSALLPWILEAAARFESAGGPDVKEMEELLRERGLTMPDQHGWPRLWDDPGRDTADTSAARQ